MKISFNEYFGRSFSVGDFTLKARDAFETAKNIKTVFVQQTGWFQSPKPMAVAELATAYNALCPDMEIMHPGVVDKMLQPEMIRQLGFGVDGHGNVSYIP